MVDWGDIAAIALDPTGTLYATKKTIETAAEVTEEWAGAIAEVVEEAAKPEKEEVLKPKWKRVCCPLFQIQDDFLLDVRNGTVWKYDSNSNEFKLVPREATDVQKAALGIMYADLVVGLQDAKTKWSSKLHYSLREEFEDRINTLIKVLIAKQKGLIPTPPAPRPRSIR